MLRKQFRRKIKLEFTDNRAEKHQAIPSPFAPCVATTGRTRALGDDARPTRAALALPLKADLEVEHRLMLAGCLHLTRPPVVFLLFNNHRRFRRRCRRCD
jgi:hypothetical protein